MKIYLIRNKYSGKVYVGSTSCTRQRWSKHRTRLRKDKHTNRRLQKDWNRYGEDAFIFEVVSEANTTEEAYQEEQRFMDQYKSYEEGFGYNILPNAGTPKGRVHIEPTKRKMSEAAKGRKLSLEQRSLSSKINRHPLPNIEELERSITKESKGSLNEEQVLEILRRLDDGEFYSQVAADFRITITTVGRIRRGERYKPYVLKYLKQRKEAV